MPGSMKPLCTRFQGFQRFRDPGAVGPWIWQTPGTQQGPDTPLAEVA